MSQLPDRVANVRAVLDILHGGKGLTGDRWFVPEHWNHAGYTGGTSDPGRPGELCVDPYDFFASCIEEAIQEGGAGPELERRHLTESVIYGMLARSFTAWPHHDAGEVCSGTFLKTMALLPLLRRYGVDIVYLLPVFRCSDRYRKGMIGSPYAIRDIYSVDPGLHDPLLGEDTGGLLEMEFRAFVELCHWLGMKVVLDFAFRTTARDSVLIADHPDWFCWIRKECAAEFRAPTVGDGSKMLALDDATLRELYTSPQTPAYLAQFSWSPDRIDAERWAAVRAAAGDDLLGAIEEQFGITTVPGFSDVINDQQPPWTDATYLRFYADNAAQVSGYVMDDQPPFVMQDGASLSKYPGGTPNEELWRYVEDVMPFYSTHFGIDGARIDMAHAMPIEHNASMVRRIRQENPSFLLWSEELDCSKGEQAWRDGFDLISGYTYYNYKRVHEGAFNHAILDGGFLASPIPVVASVETPDTPRSALIHPDKASMRLVLALNSFMPNAVPFINSGQELLETQPMNLGLDNTEEGRFVLSADDPMAGRLAFFDPYCLHWTNADTWVDTVLEDTLRLRRHYISLLSDPADFVKHDDLLHYGNLTMLCYHDSFHSGGLVVAANRSLTAELGLMLALEHPAAMSVGKKVEIVYDAQGPCSRLVSSVDELVLRPCEVLVIETET
ncbi:MAG TPA: alpha amylase [Clostridia bacterium]|nr:alpha amylase [Clostridia bacterium]